METTSSPKGLNFMNYVSLLGGDCSDQMSHLNEKLKELVNQHIQNKLLADEIYIDDIEMQKRGDGFSPAISQYKIFME